MPPKQQRSTPDKKQKSKQLNKKKKNKISCGATVGGDGGEQTVESNSAGEMPTKKKSGFFGGLISTNPNKKKEKTKTGHSKRTKKPTIRSRQMPKKLAPKAVPVKQLEPPRPTNPARPELPRTPQEPSRTPQEPSRTPQEPSRTPQEPSRTPQEPSRTPQEASQTPKDDEQQQQKEQEDKRKKLPALPPPPPPAKKKQPPSRAATEEELSQMPPPPSTKHENPEKKKRLQKVPSDDDLQQETIDQTVGVTCEATRDGCSFGSTGSLAEDRHKKRLPVPAQAAMDEFFKHVMLLKWADVVQEFRLLEGIKPTAIVPRSQMMTAYDATVPCLESTRFVSQGVDFYHASRFTMPTKSGIKDIRFILAQAPPTERAVEDFWQTVFHAEPALIFLLAPLYEEGGGCAFFLAQAGQYETYGQMMVTTKRAESFNYGTAYLFEVLPEGCSNALFIRMIHCERWEPRITPSLRGFLPLMQMCRDIDPSAPVLCVSRKGTGRPAVLAAATTVYNRLLQGLFTPIQDVAIHLRNQRAGSFENMTQYSFVYLAVAGYIKRRTGEAQWGDVMEHMSQWGPELAKQLEDE